MTEYRCSACGAKAQDGSLFCELCGGKVETAEIPDETMAEIPTVIETTSQEVTETEQNPSSPYGQPPEQAQQPYQQPYGQPEQVPQQYQNPYGQPYQNTYEQPNQGQQYQNPYGQPNQGQQQYQNAYGQPNQGQQQYQNQNPYGQQTYQGSAADPSWPLKSKTAAGLLALFVGGLGIHKFYLGQVGLGIVYLLFCWTGIPAIIAFIEAIIYLTMDDRAFEQKYHCRLQ